MTKDNSGGAGFQPAVSRKPSWRSHMPVDVDLLDTPAWFSERDIVVFQETENEEFDQISAKYSLILLGIEADEERVDSAPWINKVDMVDALSDDSDDDYCDDDDDDDDGDDDDNDDLYFEDLEEDEDNNDDDDDDLYPDIDEDLGEDEDDDIQ